MQIFYLIPIRQNVGLKPVALGVVRALQRQGYWVNFVKPVAQEEAANEPSLHFARAIYAIEMPDPVSLVRADERLAAGQEPDLLEDLVGLCLRAAEGTDVLV
ncbi:MAG: AAA family ATPase [Gammaproteobacteria bacterium]|nr:AAA family ATPase [Gammaproteobacteria bacterium]HRX71154.1 AAA family ATPase [Candidatus Competibacteraceae bacterium]